LLLAAIVAATNNAALWLQQIVAATNGVATLSVSIEIETKK